MKKPAKFLSRALFNNPGGFLLSHAVARAVPSAPRGLTSVFGMGTGVTLSTQPPEKRCDFGLRISKFESGIRFQRKKSLSVAETWRSACKTLLAQPSRPKVRATELVEISEQALPHGRATGPRSQNRIATKASLCFSEIRAQRTAKPSLTVGLLPRSI